MAKGFKTCSNCGLEVKGVRTKVCPYCQTSFAFKPKALRPIKGKDIKWTELQAGDIIKILQGSGPYWLNEDGEKICMGYYGKFKVKRIVDNGIEAYPYNNKIESGLCYIYMGPAVMSKYGTHLEPHTIRKLAI
jgi:hypothetical protein